MMTRMSLPTKMKTRTKKKRKRKAETEIARVLHRHCCRRPPYPAISIGTQKGQQAKVIS
jgi:hypothetical protein